MLQIKGINLLSPVTPYGVLKYMKHMMSVRNYLNSNKFD